MLMCGRSWLGGKGEIAMSVLENLREDGNELGRGNPDHASAVET